MQGQHAKVYLLLWDPEVAAELCAYVCSNKWAMDPAKLAKFSLNQLVPSTAKEYLQHITREEIPRGLKRYMDLELFPQIYMKVGRGISVSTACCWLHLEGFRYTTHKKGLYFDGHDQPDVVEYRQNVFLPAMKSYEPCLVRYMVGNVDTEQHLSRSNYVERRLVLVPQDEITSQANNISEKMWVLDSQYWLRKGQGVASIRVTQSCQLLDGWKKGHKHSSTVRTMMDTGMESCL